MHGVVKAAERRLLYIRLLSCRLSLSVFRVVANKNATLGGFFESVGCISIIMHGL